jgi:hypothetical protein
MITYIATPLGLAQINRIILPNTNQNPQPQTQTEKTTARVLAVKMIVL